MIYLASPYSHDNTLVRETRFRMACRVAAQLMRHGEQVFSPIAHTHPIAEFGLPKGWEYREEFDRWYIERCDEVIVLMIDGWKTSRGVCAEIILAKEFNKPIRYMDP